MNKRNKPPSLEELEIGGAVYKTALTNKFRKRKPWVRPDDKKILAVIPGTIWKILVSEGDQVETGAPILILEAMKMRNEVRATHAGKIKQVHVGEGALVAKDQLLIEFD